MTTGLVRQHAMIVTEDLAIRNMTASAKGTVETPGRRAKQKAGMNGVILDEVPGFFSPTCASKRKKPDVSWVSRILANCKPSRSYPVSGKILSDGRVIFRDQASAWVLWKIGQEQAAGANPETALRAAQAV